MQPAKQIDLERLAAEFTAWRAVEETQRSAAPGWWWGPAMALRGDREPMPAELAMPFGLPAGASFGDAAALMMRLMAPQKTVPQPGDFPRRRQRREPQPGDEPATRAAE